MTEPNILESEKFKTIIGFLTSNESGINQGIMFLETFPDLFKLFKPPSNSHGTWLGVEKIEIKMNAKVKINKRVSKISLEIDSLETVINQKIIEAPEMINLIKNTPAWRTLEIEELSDKNRIPINSFKNKEEN